MTILKTHSHLIKGLSSSKVMFGLSLAAFLTSPDCQICLRAARYGHVVHALYGDVIAKGREAMFRWCQAEFPSDINSCTGICVDMYSALVRAFEKSVPVDQMCHDDSICPKKKKIARQPNDRRTTLSSTEALRSDAADYLIQARNEQQLRQLMEAARGTFTQIDDMTDGDLHELFMLIRGENERVSL
jgi:hypothetical protein